MNKIIYSLSLALLALGAISCDNSEQAAPWQAAEPCSAPGIFFANQDNIFSVTIGDDTRIAIPVQRTEADGELTVPLVAETGHPDLQVPSSLTFADGQDLASIIIDLAGIPTKELISLHITFPADYINPYVGGPTEFDGSVIVSDWEPVSDSPVQLQWFDWSYQPTTLFDPIDQEIMHLPGTNRYRIVNFLNSEIDFTFELQPSAYPTWVGYNRIIPLGNQVLYSEYQWAGYYNPWWFVSDDLLDWPVLELNAAGQTVELYGASFMWYDDEYQNEYCYMRLAGTTDIYGNLSDKNSAYMAFYGFYDESWDWSNFTGYIFLHFEF